jgi:hypothetical protein
MPLDPMPDLPWQRRLPTAAMLRGCLDNDSIAG